MEDTTPLEWGLLNQLKKKMWVHRGWNSKHRAYKGLYQILSIYIVAISLVFWWHAGLWTWVSDSHSCSWDTFSPVGLPWPNSVRKFGLFFSNERKGVDLGRRKSREGFERLKGRKIVINMYHVSKDSISNKRKRRKYISNLLKALLL